MTNNIGSNLVMTNWNRTNEVRRINKQKKGTSQYVLNQKQSIHLGNVVIPVLKIVLY